MSQFQSFDVIIIGAGAAGLLCAIEAGKRQKSVLVIEHAERIGKKILISGGGRCNFTNLEVKAQNYLSANEHFCKSALSQYTPADFIDLLKKHQIPFQEKKLGQLFCTHSAKDILKMLETECQLAKVKFALNCEVQTVKKEDLFKLKTSQGQFQCQSLVIATGGLSFPKLGASDFGYRLARKFGLKIKTCQPALVPLTFSQKDKSIFAELAGVSLDVIVTCQKTSFRENLLFTHRGLSGPAILQISSYWQPGDVLTIDLLPDQNLSEVLIKRKQNQEKAELKNFLSQFLPQRFAQMWCEQYYPSKPINQISDKDCAQIDQMLHHFQIKPEGSEGYNKAEVTRGGIDTDEISSKTMEAKQVPGLYFIGEVVDVTGWLGGYNFQWAWASGFVAGQYA